MNSNHRTVAGRPRQRLALAIAVGLLTGASGAVSAATFTVTSAADAGPGSLREAVLLANQTTGPDVIEFDVGLGDIVLQSDIEISETLQIIGPAGQQVVRGAGSSRLLTVRTTGAVITLQNLLLENGRAAGAFGSSCMYGDGGAVCSTDDVTLIGTTITDSAISGDYISGGGLFSLGNVTLIGSTISNNSSDGFFSRGGGLFVGGDLEMRDSIVSGNSTAGSSSSGGGVAFYGDALIYNSVISGNSTADDFSHGGGLAGFGTLLLEDSSVIGNSTTGAAARGGGLQLRFTSQIVNSTISGNSTAAADAPGGGLFVLGTNLAVANSTIVDNSSTAGAGGIESVAQENLAYSVLLESTILSGNSGPEGNFRALPGSGTIFVGVVDSLFGDPASEITGTNSGNIFTALPGLGALLDNGCAKPAGAAPGTLCVPTHLPEPTSAAIDAGSNRSALPFDQRGSGFSRTLGTATDIGAVEAQPPVVPPPPPPPPVPADLVVSKDDGKLLVEPGDALAWTIRYANAGELPASDVELIETVPEATRLDPRFAGDWLCEDIGASGERCRLPIGTLAAAAQGTVDFGVLVDSDADAEVIVNRIEIISADSQATDPDLTNNVAQVITPLSRLGKLPLPDRRTPDGSTRSGVGDPDGFGRPPRLGEAAAAIGDINGDGLADVAISAPGADVLLLVLGQPFEDGALALPLSQLPSAASPGFRVEADDGLGGLGDRVAGIADANGDGLDDLVFGDNAVALDPQIGRIGGSFVLPGFDPPPAFVIDQNNRLAPSDGIVLENGVGDSAAFIGALAGAGDFNADGLNDFLLVSGSGFGPDNPEISLVFGTPDLIGFSGQQFAVQAQTGSDGLLLTRSGASGTTFGTSLAAVGDFNGDGIDDIAISEPSPGGGQVYVLFGDPVRASNFEGRLDMDALDGRIGFTLAGGVGTTRFGSRVAAAGDVDGDGLADLLVSEQRPAGEPGRVHLVFGTDAALPATVNLAAPGSLRVSRILGAVADDRLGQASAALGDIDGDGLDDFALGAPGMAERFGDQPPVPDTGRVFVLFGNASLPSEISIAALEPAQGYSLIATEPAIGFGRVVAGPGDFNGDGVPDLLVTAPGVGFDGVPGFGQYWIVSGSLRPAPAGQQLEILGFDATPDTVIVGESFALNWNAVPDDAATTCSGTGLPGTDWSLAIKPASGSESIDSSVLPPGSYIVGLECQRDGQSVLAEVLLELEELPLAINEFLVDPASVVLGESFALNWSAVPDDSGTTCSGTGLPGTDWSLSIKPASGSEMIDSSALPPGSYVVGLECQRNGQQVDAAVDVQVLPPPTELILTGQELALPFFGDVFVQFDLTNVGDVPGEMIVLEITVPAGYETLGTFSLAGSCAAGDQAGGGAISCDPASIPAWQCVTAVQATTCGLARLPSAGLAALVIQLRGQGPAGIDAAAQASNADRSEFQIFIGN